MDRLTKEQRHRNMSRIRSTNTSIERLLCKQLRSRGYGYRRNYKDLPGKPDIVLTKYRITVFCDSDFFHGRDWPELKKRLKAGNNPDFWISKIEKNMERDERNNRELSNMGWKVLRFWGSEIQKDADSCVSEIESQIIELVADQI